MLREVMSSLHCEQCTILRLVIIFKSLLASDQELSKHKADANAVDKNGLIPLHRATYR